MFVMATLVILKSIFYPQCVANMLSKQIEKKKEHVMFVCMSRDVFFTVLNRNPVKGDVNLLQDK